VLHHNLGVVRVQKKPVSIAHHLNTLLEFLRSFGIPEIRKCLVVPDFPTLDQRHNTVNVSNPGRTTFIGGHVNCLLKQQSGFARERSPVRILDMLVLAEVLKSNLYYLQILGRTNLTSLSIVL
jgi:hypothetical protein